MEYAVMKDTNKRGVKPEVSVELKRFKTERAALAHIRRNHAAELKDHMFWVKKIPTGQSVGSEGF